VRSFTLGIRRIGFLRGRRRQRKGQSCLCFDRTEGRVIAVWRDKGSDLRCRVFCLV